MQKTIREFGLRKTVVVGIVLLVSFTTACTFSSTTSSSPSQATTTTVVTSTTPSSLPQVDRHGLPEDVPLPNNAMFVDSKNSSVNYSTGPVNLPKIRADCIGIPSNKNWLWMVANDAAAMQQFYQSNLTANGWPSPRVHPACKGDNPVTSSCKSNTSAQILLVEIGAKIILKDAQGNPISTLTAPIGKVLLAIALVPAEHGHVDPTLGIFIPGAADVYCS